MQTGDYKDLDGVPEKVAATTAGAARNSATSSAALWAKTPEVQARERIREDRSENMKGKKAATKVKKGEEGWGTGTQLGAPCALYTHTIINALPMHKLGTRQSAFHTWALGWSERKDGGAF